MLMVFLFVLSILCLLGSMTFCFRLSNYMPEPREVEQETRDIGIAENSLLSDCVDILVESRAIETRLARGEDTIALHIIHSSKRDNLLNRVQRLKKAS
ncbi:hypothetical protein BB427_11395 [Pseudoalteromonas sp. BMB]|nr:hypothetical protein BB427_11395 [Pseudoalteromonas sp. BMB]